MFCYSYRCFSLMYCITTSSSTLPSVSAKCPSAQKLSPHGNPSISRNSFRITQLVPAPSACAAYATLLLGFVWRIRSTCSSREFSSLILPLFIRHVWYNNPFRPMAILPRSTRRRRYFGIHTRFHLGTIRKAAIHPQA